MPTEYIVAGVDDLRDGQMKQVKVGERAVLLVRLGGEYHALGSTCPHQGGPLAEGTLHEGHIRCPWHQAVYDAASGDLQQPPSLESLPKFQVEIRGADVVVVIPDEFPETRLPAMSKPDPTADGRTFVIVGGGAAGLVAAETLRQEGFRGRIALVTREQQPPYDRTELSKHYLASAKAKPPTLRTEKFCKRHGIELHTGRSVAEVDAAAKTVAATDGWSMKYDRLMLATGSAPRRLGVADEGLKNVMTLRSLDDCDAIRAALAEAKQAVVVGSSFIGMEVASSLAARGLKVTVVAPGAVPFERVFGREVGEMLLKLHRGKGVDFRLGEKVARFEGDGQVRSAVLEGGETLAADLVVVGVGISPLGGIKGVPSRADGSVAVDSRMAAGPDIFAAGDIAAFPDWRTGEPIRIEHWRLAEQHGRVAARNMAGRAAEYAGPPFFWTSQHKENVAYVGYAAAWDEVAFDGRPADGRFVAYYIRGERVLAAAGCQEDRRMCELGELLAAAAPPTLERARVGR